MSGGSSTLSGTLPRVGLIGLGAMGMGAARSILGAGHGIAGCDIDAAARKSFAAAGGRAAATPAEAARDADVLVVFVVNAAQVEAVLFGENGAADALPAGAVVMQCATVAPRFARELGDRLAARGLHLIDAPVSGGTARAHAGSLSVMASGAPEAFDAAASVLDAMAETVHRLGDEPGQGSAVKLVNQHLCGIHIAAAAEAMALGVRAGIEPQVLYDVITRSAGNSWMFENRVPHILAGDYTPHSAVDIFVKDLGIVADSGREMVFPLPLAAVALQQFMAASAAGHGREDDSAVVKVYAALAGLDLPRPQPADAASAAD